MKQIIKDIVFTGIPLILLALLVRLVVYSYSDIAFSVTGTTPNSILIDGDDNMYVANLNSDNVSKITPAGVSTILGTTGSEPWGVVMDGDGNIYTANSESDNVSKITPAGVSTILGTTGDHPTDIAIDGDGNIYTPNAHSDNVSKITPAGVSTILGTTGSVPQALVLDDAGNVYVTNYASDNVSKITPAGVSTILGNTADQPEGIVIDDAGNIYTANTFSNNVSKITPAGVSTVLADTGDGPFFIIIDDAGNIYTTNSISNNVSKITPAGVSTIIGVTGSEPAGIALDSLGNVFVVNTNDDTITKITNPTISEITPVPDPTTDDAITYTFYSNSEGTITYGGSCSSATTDAIVGDNDITFDPLLVGDYDDCTITITDLFGSSNVLSVSPFTVSDSLSVITSPATNITKNEAILNGEITSVLGGDATERGFEYGLTTAYGTTFTEAAGPYGVGTFFTNVSDLDCGTTYHYRAYATNIIGTAYGEDVTFRTTSCVTGGGSFRPIVLDPEVTISATLTSINLNESSTITWTSSRAISCSAPWTASTEISGDQIVYPTLTTNYSITCYGETGTSPASASVTINVQKPPTLIEESCEDPKADNYGEPLPCIYPDVEEYCEDPEATNYGELLPCIYAEVLAFCEDLEATNYGELLPCIYPTISTERDRSSGGGKSEDILGRVQVFVDDPLVRMVKNIAIAIPVLVSLLALLVALLSGLPFFNYLMYFFIAISQFLGFTKAANPWGVVYDARTKKPIPFARVEVLNEQQRKLQSTIADANGRYGFLIPAQTSMIELRASCTNYVFPSQGEPSIIEQRIYPNIYKGGAVKISNNTANLDLPMDPRNKVLSSSFYFGISSIRLNNVLIKIANILFLLGGVLGITNVVVNPSAISISIVVLILFTLVLRKTGFKLKPFGLTKDKISDKVLPFSFIALHNEKGERTNFTVSDNLGRYFLITTKGNYLLRAYTPSYVPETRTKELPIVARKGWVSREIKM